MLLSGLLAALLTQVSSGRASPGRYAVEATSAPTAEDVNGYCAYVDGLAKSERVLLVSPELVAYFGLNNSADSIIAAESFPVNGYTYIPSYELVIAGQYHFGHLFESFATASRADADCLRYQYVSALHTVVQAFQEPEATVPALQARAAALKEAMPHAEEILASTREAVQQAKATADELNATELRVDELRADVLQTTELLEAQSLRIPPPPIPVEELMARRDAAERSLGYLEVQEQRSKGWDLVFRAGYDRLYGLRDQLPLFASVGLIFNVGWFFEGNAARLAMNGRRAWADAQTGGLDDRVKIALTRAKAQLNADTKRYQQTTVLLADLEDQMRSVTPLGGDKVRRYRDTLWFDLTRVRVEHAFLKANVEELQGWLCEGSTRL